MKADATTLDIVETAPASQLWLAVKDVSDGLRRWSLWTAFGWQDVRQRYRRSRLGPFWLTLSMGAMVAGVGVLYAGLFKTDVSTYLPLLTTGMVIWGLLSGIITEGCESFISADGIIRQVRVPLSSHALRVVWRNFIIFAHNSVIVLLVLGYYRIWPGWTVILALAGVLLVAINGIWVSVLLGLLSARFRDVPQIVASIVQVAFFLTPVMWSPSQVENSHWLDLNPFYYFVEIVRAPLLGHFPEFSSLVGAGVVTVVGSLVALGFYSKYRWRIAYWV